MSIILRVLLVHIASIDFVTLCMGFMNAISVALIDDHPLMIEALSSLLKRIGGFTVVGTGTTAFDVVEISRQTHPQIAVVDLSIPGDVYGAIANAIKISSSTKIVAFNCQQVRAENMRLLPSWRRESNWDRTFSTQRRVVDGVRAAGFTDEMVAGQNSESEAVERSRYGAAGSVSQRTSSVSYRRRLQLAVPVR